MIEPQDLVDLCIRIEGSMKHMEGKDYYCPYDYPCDYQAEKKIFTIHGEKPICVFDKEYRRKTNGRYRK